MSKQDLARLPSISLLLEDPRLSAVPHAIAVRAAREVVEQVRVDILAGGSLPPDIPEQVVQQAATLREPMLKRVINATGIVLHTNLGRAPLAPEAVAAVTEVARGYANVELDLETGQRGERLDPITGLLTDITGAESAVAVNNNAAAVLLAMTALAPGREVIVSRGELVEIGGSFRIPDVISAGGARLVEVGTTNRTRTQDFADAITPDTALLLRVHPSNFRIIGFTEQPDRAEMVALARERGIPLVEDLGSGLFGDPPAQVPGVDESEDAVEQAIADGVDLACFSGDKLLSGPQAGIIVGRSDLVQSLRKHPLYRALRLDKLVLAALEATLRLYVEGRSDATPGRTLLGRTPDDCDPVAHQIVQALGMGRVDDDVSFSGGGALPARGLPTRVVVFDIDQPEAVSQELRRHDPPVVARVARDTLIVDPRTLLPGDLDELIMALRATVAVVGQRG